MTHGMIIFVNVLFILWAVAALSLCGVMIWVTWFDPKPTPPKEYSQ